MTKKFEAYIRPATSEIDLRRQIRQLKITNNVIGFILGLMRTGRLTYVYGPPERETYDHPFYVELVAEYNDRYPDTPLVAHQFNSIVRHNFSSSNFEDSSYMFPFFRDSTRQGTPFERRKKD